MFARLVGNTNRQIATSGSRRTYSFISSKSSGGGGKFLTSSKPLNSTKAVTAPKAESANGDTVKTSGVDEPQPASTGPQEPSFTTAPTWNAIEPVQHTAVTTHDLNLHNFFSLHRPLLLISQPTTSLFEPAPAGLNDFNLGNAFAAPPPPVPTKMDSFEDAPEASPEADADTARLLSRALVVNRLGSAVNWESTLKTLGLDLNEGRIMEQEALMEEFDAYMDSTKRKRRKKMKKHKLKKRRRLQRSERIKIGK